MFSEVFYLLEGMLIGVITGAVLGYIRGHRNGYRECMSDDGREGERGDV